MSSGRHGARSDPPPESSRSGDDSDAANPIREDGVSGKPIVIGIIAGTLAIPLLMLAFAFHWF